MSKELSNAAEDALVNKGIDDGKNGDYNPPHSESIPSQISSSIFDTKDEQEDKNAQNDAYKEGYRTGRNL
jgi:hypothetical protein